VISRQASGAARAGEMTDDQEPRQRLTAQNGPRPERQVGRADHARADFGYEEVESRAHCSGGPGMAE
jgi:hypothetical protein